MAEAGDTIFPFGKHKGKKLREIPVHYLDWALGVVLRGDLRGQIEMYLETQTEYDQMDDAKVGKITTRRRTTDAR